MSDQVVDPVEGQDNPEPERPEWLPANFDSPESFAKSYTEAQRKITELGQEKKGLEESVQSLAQQFEDFTAQQSRPDPQNVLSQWQEQYDVDPFNTTLSLAQAVAQSTAQQILQQQQAQNAQPATSPEVVGFMADQTMGQKYQDWEDYRDQVKDVIGTNPLFNRDELWSSPGSAHQAFESAYKMVKANDMLTNADVTQQQQADTRAMKLAAQTVAGASGRTPAVPDTVAEWEAVKAARPKNYWE